MYLGIFHSVIRLEQIYEFIILYLVSCFLRDNDYILLAIRNLDVTGTACSQQMSVIRESGTHAYSTCVLVDDSAYRLYFTAIGIQRSVSQCQLNSWEAIQKFSLRTVLTDQVQ